MASDFVASSSQFIDRFRTAIAAEDWSNLALEAHSLGGGAAVFGGVEVQKIALQLEDAALRNDCEAAAQSTLQLEQALAEMMTHLKAFVRDFRR
jgi:HPt (histidine-containing phosphotransfer) domain-containing protein